MKQLFPVLAILAAALTGCESTSNAPRQTDSFMLEADEARIWERARETIGLIRKAGYIVDDPAGKVYLEAICKRLYPAVDTHPSEFEVLILRDPTVNAFVLPNGVVCVNSGLLSAMESEAQIAIVLAHELAHFEQRHSLLGFRHLKAQAAFHSVLGVGTLGYGSLISLVGFPAAISGHSKAAERDADRIGWNWYLNAGYSPSEAPVAFVKLQEYIKENKEKEPYFFGSHPHLQERIDTMTALSAQANADQTLRDGVVGHDLAFEPLRRIWIANAFLDFDIGNLSRAGHLIERIETLAPNLREADFAHAKAELLRRRGGPENHAAGIETCRSALLNTPLHPGLRRSLGLIYFDSGDYRSALTELRDALVLDPEYPKNPFILHYVKQCEEKLSL